MTSSTLSNRDIALWCRCKAPGSRWQTGIRKSSWISITRRKMIFRRRRIVSIVPERGAHIYRWVSGAEQARQKLKKKVHSLSLFCRSQSAFAPVMRLPDLAPQTKGADEPVDYGLHCHCKPQPSLKKRAQYVLRRYSHFYDFTCPHFAG